MAKVITDDKHYKDIADTIRSNLGDKTTYTPDKMAIGVKNSYMKGLADGRDEGVEDGIKQGKQAEYDAFWDVFQQNGARLNYRCAFFNWDNAGSIFKPKYDIKPVGNLSSMFQDFNTFISLPNVCTAQGIVMDFSKVTSFTTFLYDSSIYRIGVIDCSGTKTLANAFQNAGSLITIDKLILHEGITSYADAFANDGQLTNVVVEGTIAGSSLNLSYSTKLTHNSLMSFINAFKDYSGTGTTRTATFGATNLAKLTDAEKAIATQKGWTLA